MNILRNTSRTLPLYLMVSAFLAMAVLFGSGCKSKKKVTETPVSEVTEEVKESRNSARTILNSDLSADELEKKLEEIRSKNVEDNEVDDLIRRIEDKIKQERKNEESERVEEENRKIREELDRKQADLSTPEGKLINYIKQIANAPNANVANSKINQALKLFSSPSALTLVVINKEGGVVDYDKPTTIKKYLEYVKDQKKVDKKIDKIVYDNSGKIKEIELIKK